MKYVCDEGNVKEKLNYLLREIAAMQVDIARIRSDMEMMSLISLDSWARDRLFGMPPSKEQNDFEEGRSDVLYTIRDLCSKRLTSMLLEEKIDEIRMDDLSVKKFKEYLDKEYI